MSDAFEVAWTLMKNEEKEEKSKKKKSKSKFKGYSKNRISGRAERQGKARAWSQSRKVKRKRTRMRYARNKTRGNVRPKLRRQLGAGGERMHVKKAPPNQKAKPEHPGDRSYLKYGGRQPNPRYCIRPGCNTKISSSAIQRNTIRELQCGTCKRLYGDKGLPGVNPSDVAPT